MFLHCESLPKGRWSLVTIVTGIAIGIAGAVVLALLWAMVYRKRAEAQVAEARREAGRIVDDAKKSADASVKEANLEAEEKLLAVRSEFDKKDKQRRDERTTSGQRLQAKEDTIEQQTQRVDQRMREV